VQKWRAIKVVPKHVLRNATKQRNSAAVKVQHGTILSRHTVPAGNLTFSGTMKKILKGGEGF
jgi:hypothetical protein